MCTTSPVYFLHNYVQIYDAVKGAWIPFHLWEAQRNVLNDLKDNLLVVILKARQLGQTWLVLGYALWLILCHPSVTVLLFSRRDDESQYLLERLRGMYKRLPPWMQARKVLSSNDHEWHLSNGSSVYAFPTTAGDSYTASLVIVDEADLVPDLDFLMNAVKPTIDNGGRMVLLSRSNKDDPQSAFKRIYKGAKEGQNSWKAIFLPWYVHPKRDEAWYEAQRKDVYSRTLSYDDLWQQYPATDTEALVARTSAKRIPAMWIEQCMQVWKPLEEHTLMAIHPKLRVYREPARGSEYIIGADPAEGNPNSDASSLVVLDALTAEEVASLSERIEPGVFSTYVRDIAHAFNGAGVLVERNNHGHVVINNLRAFGDVKLLSGSDGAPGYQTTSKSKAAMYSNAADTFKDGLTILHTESTYYQIGSIEGATLKAPQGEFDDEATAYVLALMALNAPDESSFVYSYLTAQQQAVDRRLAAVMSVR